MSTKRLRHDLDHATSALLLLAVVAASLTGLFAHVWDLNDFAWHTWSGYAMAALATAHVVLTLDRLVSYWQFRSRQGTRRVRAWRSRRPAPVPATGAQPHAPPASAARRTPPARRPRPGGVARRALLTAGAATVGGLTGWAAARRVGTSTDPGANDAGMVYHRLSRPGVADAIDSVVTWGVRPAPPKQYPGVATVDLPAADGAATPTGLLWTAVVQRHSVRDYADRPLTRDQLATLLFLTAGARRQGGRTAPSSGALYRSRCTSS